MLDTEPVINRSIRCDK